MRSPPSSERRFDAQSLAQHGCRHNDWSGGERSRFVPAHAQVGVEVGPGGARVYENRPSVERRVIERRTPSRRVVVEEDEDDEVCETRTRRVRVNGVWRTRRMTVCE